MSNSPSITEIKQAAQDLKAHLVRTPCADLNSDRFRDVLPANSHVSIKLELFQQAGSFKSRGALLGINLLSKAEKERGIVAASGGNHALAVSWAARAANVQAQIYIPKTVDPVRVEGCRSFGAEVILVENITSAFEEMQKAAKNEGKAILHPFEGAHMTLGAATCGYEYATDRPDSDIFVIPVGGGGLISGMSAAIKQMLPNAKIFGVEPMGADTMYRSFKSGKLETIESVNTIADSLGSPYTLPYSFAVTHENVDEIVRITDDEMRNSMQILFDNLKLIAEPACSASLAAIIGPLRQECEGKKVSIIACGSNISLEKFTQIIGRT